MHTYHTFPARTIRALLVALAALTASCQEPEELTAPPALAAKPATGPVVNNVVPDSSKRGVRLDLTVNGSGYDQGSVVALERQGVPAAGITVSSTTFVSSRKLVADVTIAATADTGKVDVAVTTTGGRKGVGIEVFTVEYEIAELGMFGGTWSIAMEVNDQGVIVGASCTEDCLSRAFRWTETTGLQDLGTLPGWSRSYASAITASGAIFGTVECRPGDPGCNEPTTQRQLVRWDKVGGSWVITPVDGCSIATPFFVVPKFLVNNNDQCMGPGLVVQTLSGGAVVNEEPLPRLVAGGSHQAFAISDAPMVVGIAFGNEQPPEPVLWFRRSTGAWEILRLGFPSTGRFAYASDVGEPDAAGRVRVAGYVQEGNDRRDSSVRALRWTLEPDGLGGWRVVSTEVIASTVQQMGQSNAWAGAINDAGDMVGIAGSHTESGLPMKWPAGGETEVLPVVGGGGKGSAMAINSHGLIVGAVWDRGHQCNRAAVWRKN
ncbi:MAG: hypothetical protein ACREMH_00090 [Gemmatimonadales bacterium]